MHNPIRACVGVGSRALGTQRRLAIGAVFPGGPLTGVCLFVSTTLGVRVPVLSCLPRLHNSPLAKCGCKKHPLDLNGDHTSTCTAHSGATKAHDWMVSVLGPLFRTAARRRRHPGHSGPRHMVRTQHGVTASAGQRRGDVEIRNWNYLRDSAGPRSLVFDLSIAHDRFGSSSHVLQNGLLSHPQDLDGPLRVAAQRKINAYGQQYADNRNISFLPLVMSTSCRAQRAVTLRSAPSRAATARAVA